MKLIEGNLAFQSGRIAIVVARFNSFICESLLQGAIDILKRHGMPEDNIDVIRVPGAYELPLAAQRAAKTGRYAGILALGAIIRGATAHFDYVAGPCANGLAQVGLQHNLPVSFGVLTTETIEQAIERAGTKAGNKGAETAIALLEMMNLLPVIDKG